MEEYKTVLCKKSFRDRYSHASKDTHLQIETPSHTHELGQCQLLLDFTKHDLIQVYYLGGSVGDGRDCALPHDCVPYLETRVQELQKIWKLVDRG